MEIQTITTITTVTHAQEEKKVANMQQNRGIGKMNKKKKQTHEQNLNDSRLHVCIILTCKGSITLANPSKLAGGGISYRKKIRSIAECH